MNSYQKMIIQDTGCPEADAALIEQIMRECVFHSTLDWQTRSQFRRGARRARRILDENRELFAEDRRLVADVIARIKAGQTDQPGHPT